MSSGCCGFAQLPEASGEVILRYSLDRDKHINRIYRYNSEGALERLRGIGSEQKKSPPRNPLPRRELQKGLDFVPRTGFEPVLPA